MKDKDEIITIIADEQTLRTRREFIKGALMTGAVITIPISINPGCGGGSDSKTPAASKSCFEITFSKPMDTASVEAAVSIEPDAAGFFEASPTWSENDTVALFECADGVAPGDYALTIAATAKDRAGNFIDGNGDGTTGDAYSGVMAF